MRTWLALAAGGVVLGVLLAFGVSALRNPLVAPSDAPCTAEALGLAGTLGISRDGKKAHVGLVTPRVEPGRPWCTVFAADRRVVIIVTDADNRVLHTFNGPGGPPAGTTVSQPLRLTVPVPAARLCNARQPLSITVKAVGASSTGTTSLRKVGGRCALGG